MKIVLIIIGSLAGLYAVVGVAMFIRTLLTTEGVSPYAVSNIMMSVVPVLLGLIVCLACFQAAFRKPKSAKRPGRDR